MSEPANVPADVFANVGTNPKVVAAVNKVKAEPIGKGDPLKVVAKDGVLQWTLKTNYRGSAQTSDVGAANYSGTGSTAEFAPTTGSFTLVLTTTEAELTLKGDDGKQTVYKGEGVSVDLSNTYYGRWAYLG
ncbi:hypothetical protein SCP_0605440 [Sparassis crispa]|uniref:Uncharacterized protein n=1 Tax=Sparassis crispa TaxID=139825 RepID=A0A401GQT6_9APHY|nr:hypothetical protein SCP_0605440 [Sparassis crispa]GBE84565.1 hypothetical protein SCP_0605440 [Sparassis crispa]